MFPLHLMFRRRRKEMWTLTLTFDPTWPGNTANSIRVVGQIIFGANQGGVMLNDGSGGKLLAQ